MTPEIHALAAMGCRFVRLVRNEKRPAGGPGWQTRSTGLVDEVTEWLERRWNVGLLLGPSSGVVDVEYDEPAGREQLSAFGVLDLPTPTWRSARGEHRLFRWEPWMPAKAKLDVDALELRFGGKSAQSVLPPSRHPAGGAYEWIVRPQDVAIHAFPAQLMAQEAMA